jgi:hypothetical protein
MAISVGKLLPRATVLAAVAYGVWPTVSETLWPPAPSASESVPELASSLFSPKLPPPPTRDPFTGKLITERRPTVATKPNLTKKPAGRTAQEAARLARLATDAKLAGAVASARARETLRGFTLQATSIMGDQRMAVINGRLYAVGEGLRVARRDAATPMKSAAESPLPGAGPPFATPFQGVPPGVKPGAVASKDPPSAAAPDAASAICKIVDVLPDRVLLELDGNRMELKYPDTASGSAPQRPAAAKGGTGKKSGGKGGKGKGKR